MKWADLHSHTPLCKHAVGTADEYLRAALDKGLSFFGVSDHIPWPVGYDSNVRMEPSQFADYRASVRAIQKKARQTPLKVLYGIELDYVPGRMNEVAAAIDAEPFDYRIGSIHYVDDFAFDSPDQIHIWAERGADWVWNRYAELLCEFVDSFPFEIMGHPDLPKKFGYMPLDRSGFVWKMREAFELAASRGIAIEINTAGLRKKIHELYPSLDLLTLARKAGMPLTFGSDSHSPMDVAADFDKALELAKAAGYRSASAFQARERIDLPF